MTDSHITGLMLLVAPVAIALYRSYKSGTLKHVLIGVGGALTFAAWILAVAYLLSH